jgi:hypothetical protein
MAETLDSYEILKAEYAAKIKAATERRQKELDLEATTQRTIAELESRQDRATSLPSPDPSNQQESKPEVYVPQWNSRTTSYTATFSGNLPVKTFSR